MKRLKCFGNNFLKYFEKPKKCVRSGVSKGSVSKMRNFLILLLISCFNVKLWKFLDQIFFRRLLTDSPTLIKIFEIIVLFKSNLASKESLQCQKTCNAKLLYLLQLHHFSLSINLRATRGSRLTTAKFPPCFTAANLPYYFSLFIHIFSFYQCCTKYVVNT